MVPRTEFRLWALALLPACAWSAADGPWNDPPEEPTATENVPLTGSIHLPDGERPIGGVRVELRDGDGVASAVVVSQADGTWNAGVPTGLVQIVASTGRWGASLTRQVEAPGPPVSMVLDGASPEVLIFPRALASALRGRFLEMGQLHIHEAPAVGDAAIPLITAPQGLFDYGLVVFEHGYDLAPILAEPRAITAITDLLGSGGGLYLEGDAGRLLDALRPGAVTWETAAEEGRIFAEFADSTLQASIDWPSVSLRLPAEAPVALATLGLPLVEATVPLLDGSESPVWLALRFVEPSFGVVWCAAVAPAPRGTDWWSGDPSDWTLPDGSWDGRGALVDRLLLSL